MLTVLGFLTHKHGASLHLLGAPLFSFIHSFIYLWLCWVFVAVHRLSLAVVSRGYSSLQCAGFSLSWLLLLWSMGFRRAGFSSCGSWAQQLWLVGSRAQAQQLWCKGLVAPQHVGSSRARVQTCVPSIGRRILNRWATREALGLHYFLSTMFCSFQYTGLALVWSILSLSISYVLVLL